MTATFLLTCNIEGDTDLIGIAEELKSTLDTNGSIDVVEVKPWHRDSLGPTPPTPLVAPAH